jgi:predicted ATPase
MSECALIDNGNTELDADILLTPFEVWTNWHVIMGGPSCGKTTLINLLAAKGFRTIPEGARLYMERDSRRTNDR